jgi:hypothetical protein
LYQWNDDDALSDVLLIQLGQYPDRAETRIDYREIMKRATEAAEVQINQKDVIPREVLDHPGVSYLSRHGMQRHYGIRSNWDYPGFYLGDVTNLDDLVWYWNLRALDMPILFIDRNHLSRYEQVIPAWLKLTTERLASRQFEHHRKPAVWHRREHFPNNPDAISTELRQIFGTDGPFTICGIDTHLWNGLNLQAPMMVLGETAQLGVLTGDAGKPKLSFALGDKPYCNDPWFRSQHLVASLSFIGGCMTTSSIPLSPPTYPS